MLKKTLICGSLVAATALSPAAFAHGGDAAAAAIIGIGIGAAIASSGPVYAAPPVVYAPPPAVYYAPPPAVVYQRPVVYAAPAPVAYYGYGGGWEGRREWRHHEWREHHGHWER